MRRNDVELFLSSSENGSHLLGWECNDDDNGDCMKSRAALDDSTNGGYLAGWTRVPTGFRWGIDND